MKKEHSEGGYETIKDYSSETKIERRYGEALIEYQKRLNTYCAGIIGLIESYEKLANIERFRNLLPLTKELIEGENPEAIKSVIDLINKLNREVKWYETNYNSLPEKKEICEKKKTLDSLLL